MDSLEETIVDSWTTYRLKNEQLSQTSHLFQFQLSENNYNDIYNLYM